MTERVRRSDTGMRTARGRVPRALRAGVQPAPAIPVPPPGSVSTEGEPTILGFPTETDEGAEIPVAGPDIPASPALVVVRRADPLGATPLVLAGVAANVSLLLSWAPGEGPSGLTLVQGGARALGSGPAGDALWQPFVVVLCGGLLVVLGFLMMVPARAHRLVGVLALVVTLGAAAAVVLLAVDTGLADEQFGPGLWCAVAVPVLGLLGALKAMLTAPLVSLAPVRRGHGAAGSAGV
jgi:hypothetical protein